MTAGAMDGDRERCLDAGVDDTLRKPFSRRSLAAELRDMTATGGLSFAAVRALRFHTAVSPPLRLHPADLLALCGSHGP